MDKLPKGWKWTTISDVCNKITDGTHNTPSYIDKGVPFISVKDITKGFIDFSNTRFISIIEHKDLSKRCNPEMNDILYTKIGTTGVAKIVDTDIQFSIFVSLALLKPNHKVIESYFFEHLLNSPICYEQSQSKTRGVANRNLVLTDIKSIQIPLPPLSEQTRIVSKLDTLFARIDKSIILLEENIKHTKGLMASVLEKVFRDAESKWKYKSLKLITSKIGSGSTPRGGQDSYKTSGMSLIRSMNIHDGEFRHKGLALIDDEQAKKLANVAVEKDDVLLNITGASVARCSIVDASILPARVNQHVSIIRPTSVLNPYFLQAFLISPNTKSKLLSDSGGGATREAITKSMIENLEVPIPDIKIQKNIINHIQKIKEANSKIILEQQSKLIYLKALKASLLDRAFKGEL